MGTSERTYSFDANLELSDNAAAYTATGWAQKGGADGVLDLGGNQSASPKQQAGGIFMLVVDVTALDAVTTDEAYRLIVVGSNDPLFANGAGQVLGELELAAGVLSVLGLGAAGVPAIATAGRYELPFVTDLNGTKYQYLKLFNVLTGTTPSISYEAFVAEIPEA